MTIDSDRWEISELLARYSWAASNKDWAGFRDVFVPDARIDYSSAGGPAGSLDEALAWLTPTLSIFDVAEFQGSNIVITFDGDDRAAVRSMFRTVMRIPGADGAAPTIISALGYYKDVVVRTTHGWRIHSRTEELRVMS
jgi:hypothetical protein